MRKFFGWLALILMVAIGGALLYFRTPDTDPAAMRAKYGAAPSQFVDLGGGLTVHLRDTGSRSAPVLMLIHGSNASLHTWEPWAARLGQRYRIIRFDLPGHGLTGPSPSRDYSSAAFADVIEKVRAKLGVDHMILAGNSMGGGVAWHYALMYPEHLRGLILVDASGQPEPGNHSAPLAFRIARMPVLRNLAAMITPRSLIADSLPTAFSDKSFATDKAIDLYWELLRYPGNRTATIDRFSTTPDYATTAKLARIKTPTLILWGDEDHLIPVSSAHWLHDRLPGSQLIIYPKTGHVPMEERADQSAADVYRFIELHTEPASPKR
ncbi:alpha/beta fold hydrolase [Sphingomonas sp. 28-63-12]|uniref:alpha/beta fold hydrolase n=1 Tax=Sphingomonas sp. 28-63-12 TaxID=1970434 RepID=UPI000BC69B2C|nr:MAG: alpha/beta hydrolase [Sphingomonas sp. 28-63-12]